MKEMIEFLLKASDSQLDAKMKLYIERWNILPSALQVLEVLDHCINGSLASGFVVKLLQIIYDNRCKAEGTTHDEVAKLAPWRT